MLLMAVPRINIGGRFPSKTEQEVINWVTGVAQFMIDFQERHGRVASGESINNYTITMRKEGFGKRTVMLDVLGYTPFALLGRGPGGQPPADNIARWLRDKGLVEQFGGEESIMQAAFAIARKIAADGTLSGTGPDDTKLNPGLVAAFITNLGKQHLANIADDLAKQTADMMFRTLTK